MGPADVRRLQIKWMQRPIQWDRPCVTLPSQLPFDLAGDKLRSWAFFLVLTWRRVQAPELVI